MHERKRKIDENVRQNMIRRRVGRKITHLHLVLLNRSRPGPPPPPPLSPTSGPTSADTPRHDSSTSDVMKLRTMGGPPEELQDGLLDTERQSSRTNETGGLHGASMATGSGLNKAEKAETKGSQGDVGTGTSKDCP